MRQRPHMYILDADGQPVPCDDILTWGQWLESAEQRVVRQDEEGEGTGRVLISTVFVGLDMNYSDRGAPILWETMVFGGPLDGEQQRYSSLEEAQLGHAALCLLAHRASQKD